MSDQTIECPQCKIEIPLNDALTDKIRHQLEVQMSKELKKKNKTWLVNLNR